MCKGYENTYHPNCHKLIAEQYRHMILGLSTLLKHVHRFVLKEIPRRLSQAKQCGGVIVEYFFL